MSFLEDARCHSAETEARNAGASFNQPDRNQDVPGSFFCVQQHVETLRPFLMFFSDF